MSGVSDVSEKRNIQKNYPQKKKRRTSDLSGNEQELQDIQLIPTINNMPRSMRCPCGGGQSCIVDRRWLSDWVHEDEVFRVLNIPLRVNCAQAYTEEQINSLTNFR